MIILILSLALCFNPSNSSDEITPIELLPSDGVPEGWAATDDAMVFTGTELYRHINGGAELFHTHGFVELALKDYTKGDLEIRIEIYDMGSPAGAAGIFGANTAGLETGSEYGEGCSLDDLQIIFHRGRFYVAVTCYDVSEELKKALDAMSVNVDEAVSQLEK